MSGSFRVGYGSPAAGSGAAFLDQYDRGRAQQDAEYDRAIKEALLVRTLKRQDAEDQAVRAVMGAPSEPIEMAPPLTHPGSPSLMLGSETGGMPAGADPSMGGAVPPEAGLPAAPGAETTLPATGAVTEPGVTEQGVTMEGLRKSLAGNPAALTALASPAAQAAMKARGVLSDDEVRYRQSLTVADREGKALAREAMDALRAGDSLGFTVRQAAYYDRLASVFARTQPEQAQRARQLHQQLMKEAVRLQEDKNERKLADEDTLALGQAIEAFNQPGGQTHENYAKIMGVYAKAKSKNAQTHFLNMLNISLPKALDRIQDTEMQEFWTSFMAEAKTEGGARGKADLEKVAQKMAIAHPQAALRMLGSKTVFGETYRRLMFPNRQVSQSAFQQALDAVKAENEANVQAGTEQPLTELQAIKRAQQALQAPVNTREGDRAEAGKKRAQVTALQTELRAVESDIRRLQKAQTDAAKGLGSRDPATYDAEIAAKVKARNTLVERIKTISNATSAGMPGEVDTGDEDTDAPAPAAPPARPGRPAPAPAAAPAARPELPTKDGGTRPGPMPGDTKVPLPAKSRPQATSVISPAQAKSKLQEALAKRGKTEADLRVDRKLYDEIEAELRAGAAPQKKPAK